MEDNNKALQKIYDNFKSNVQDVDELKNIGNDVTELAAGFLKALEKSAAASLPAFIPFKKQLKTCIDEVEKAKDHPTLKIKYRKIYRQCLVLIVSGFESFMTELFTTLIDHAPQAINWPDKKKIGLDLSLLSFSSPTLGDLVVKSLAGDINFQDLQSTMRFLSEYLKTIVDVKDTKEQIILGQALRHVIIHNTNKVDANFLKQIRETKFLSNYKINEEVEISEAQYNQIRDAFLILAK